MDPHPCGWGVDWGWIFFGRRLILPNGGYLVGGFNPSQIGVKKYVKPPPRYCFFGGRDAGFDLFGT